MLYCWWSVVGITLIDCHWKWPSVTHQNGVRENGKEMEYIDIGNIYWRLSFSSGSDLVVDHYWVFPPKTYSVKDSDFLALCGVAWCIMCCTLFVMSVMGLFVPECVHMYH